MFRKNIQAVKFVSIVLAVLLFLSSCSYLPDLLGKQNSSSEESSSSLVEESSSSISNESTQEIHENGYPIKRFFNNLNNKPNLEDDFYNNINYDWISKTTINSTVPGADAFSDVASNSYAYLLGDLAKLVSDSGGYGSTDEEKLARFFMTAYDWKNRDKDGINPIMPYLDKINNISSIEELQVVSSDIDVDMIGSFVMFSISPDKHDASTKRLYLSGPMLILEEKSFYFDETDYGKKIYNAYLDYMQNLLVLTGYSTDDAKTIVASAEKIERTFAQSVLSLEDRQDDDLIYNKFDMAELQNIMPNFDIKGFLERVQLVNPEYLIVHDVGYYKTLSEIMTDDNLDDLKNYMILQTLHQTTEYLTSEHIKVERDFTNIINGTEGYREDYESAFFLTETFLGEILGKLYVENHFSEENKVYVEEIISTIITEYESRIQNLDWMGEETKKTAIEKLGAIDIKVGYPDKWTDYSDLVVNIYNDGMEGSVFKNVVNHYHFSYTDSISELDMPVDESKWAMNAYEPNAYYSPAYNEIVFPAGILQAPFFDLEKSESSNYGSIGSIIAHEISHAFDDSGRKFDKDGNRLDWWTTSDLENYNKKTQQLIDQFNACELLENYYVNGKLTLNENIADLGAVACVTSIVEKLENGSLEDLYTGYATIWRSKTNENRLINSLSDDVHAPNIFRVNNILSNIEEFYDTFKITEGDYMYLEKEKRVVIW